MLASSVNSSAAMPVKGTNVTANNATMHKLLMFIFSPQSRKYPRLILSIQPNGLTKWLNICEEMSRIIFIYL
jgi:hypothetical protein